jgi:hypothetical protein
MALIVVMGRGTSAESATSFMVSRPCWLYSVLALVSLSLMMLLMVIMITSKNTRIMYLRLEMCQKVHDKSYPVLCSGAIDRAIESSYHVVKNDYKTIPAFKVTRFLVVVKLFLQEGSA